MPAPSKTISLIIRVWDRTEHAKREDLEEAYGKVFGHRARDPVRQCFFYIGWRIRRSKAGEMRLPPTSEEFESTAEERSVTTQRRAGVTRPGAGATSRPTLWTPSTGVEATPRRAKGSSLKVSNGDIPY